MAVLEPIGTMVEGVGAYSAGRFAEATAKRDARRVLDQGRLESNEAATEGEILAGEATALQGASGFTVSGTAAAAIASLAAQTQVERGKVMWQRGEEAVSLKEQGRQAARAGRMKLLSSVIKAAGQTNNMMKKKP